MSTNPAKRQKLETSVDSKSGVPPKSNNLFCIAIESSVIKDINSFRRYRKTVLASLPLDPLLTAVKTCDVMVVNTVISVLIYHRIKSIGTGQKIPTDSKNLVRPFPTFIPRDLTQNESLKPVYHSYMSICLAIELGLHEILNNIMCFYPPSHTVFVDLFNQTVTNDDSKSSTIILDNINPICHNDILKYMINTENIGIIKSLIIYGVKVDKKNMVLAINKKNQALINVLIGFNENIVSLDIANRFGSILNS